MRNLALLLHREIHALAADRALRNYHAPNFTLKEQIAALNADRMIFKRHSLKSEKLATTPNSRFDTLGAYTDSSLHQAASHYLRVATLIEYQSLIVEIDNTVGYLFDLKRAGRKMPKAITRNGFWKYYLALIRSYGSNQLNKEIKRDIARFAFVHTLDENDHRVVTGVSWKKDAAEVVVQEGYNVLSKFLTKLDREHFELLESRDDYGSVASPYEKKWTTFIPRNHTHMVRT